MTDSQSPTAITRAPAMPFLPVGTLVIAGLGLLGGSIALAARERGLARRILAVGRRPHPEAVRRGIVDESLTDLAAAAARADLLILCTPVDLIESQLATVLDAIGDGALVTDVGSTKQRLVERAGGHPRGRAFVGSHPMVGSHLTGWENAQPALFEEGVVYLTVTDGSDLSSASRVGCFWEALGARLVYTDPARHDRLCSLLSHMPHMAAVGIVQAIMETSEDPHLVRLLAGSGLRDTTRVAMGSADVWAEICGQNAGAIAADLDRLSKILETLARRIRAADPSLRGQLEAAARWREQLQGSANQPG